MFADQITRLRAPDTTGPDGATIPSDWDTPGTILEVVYAGEFQPISSTEDIVGQQRTESTHKAFLPAAADVLATDRLRHNGIVYQVDGDPERWLFRGAEHHLEVFCFRVQGG